MPLNYKFGMWGRAFNFHNLCHDPDHVGDLWFYELVTNFNRCGLHSFIISPGAIAAKAANRLPGLIKPGDENPLCRR